MLSSARVTFLFLTLVALSFAADPDRDFSGKWLLDADHSEMHGLLGEIYPVLAIDQQTTMRCTATTSAGTPAVWTYRLDGEDSKYKLGADSMNSALKWEGAALLINTLVDGSQSYAMMDRWTLSRDHTQLSIHREIERKGLKTEGYLVYLRDGAPIAPTGAPPSPTPTAAAARPAGNALARRPETPPPAPPTSFTIPKGTHILLSLTNPVSTKGSKEGDKVYLRTAVPVAESDRIVIPKGSYVTGSISKSKPAGRGADKGEVYILFDSLTLPNGVNRDFHARLTNADTINGKVDPDEGKISGTGKGNPSAAPRDVGIGASGGVLLGGLAGHPIAGAAIGAAAGAAAALLSKNKDVVLARGTSVEMVLDRDLYYAAGELGH